MNNSTELLGKKFGRLTIVGFVHARKPQRGWLWECRCDCGKTKILSPQDVKLGKIKSCGCYLSERSKERATKFKHTVYDNRRLYSIYNWMKRRCYNSKTPRYKDYGARGIGICDEWLNDKNGFDNFVEWSITHGYSDNLSIDRIDVNGDYSPENCRWLTLTEQNSNKRDTLWVDYKGERIQLVKLCKKLNVTYDMVHNRIYSLGWDVEKAVSTPSMLDTSLRRECIKRGMNYGTVLSRINKLGWDVEKALETPIKHKE